MLAACGGGSTGTVLPHPPSSAGSASQSVTFRLTIPPASSSPASLQRRPLYVSAGTQSATISVNGAAPSVINLAAGSSNCAAAAGARTCSATIIAPVGSDTFSESLYASTNGTGTPLSQNTTTATITAGQANVVNLVLDGVVASLKLSLANAAPTVGSKTTIGLAVAAYDASGNQIIGSDPFTNAISLSDSDTSGATTLSTATVSSPSAGSAVTVTYTGQALSSATFSASATGVSTASTTLVPAPASNGTFNDYTTFGFDNQHDVYNPNSTLITPASVPNIHLAWQASLADYNTQTQPVLATEISGHTGVLFVGGGSGAVSAYDALSGKQIWDKPLGQILYNCDPSATAYFGIGGTVAYDPATQSVYVVANTNTSIGGTASNWLYHLDANGNVLGKVNVGSVESTNELNFGHTSVTLSNGVAYIGTSSTCDISSWRGRVAAVNVPAMTIANTFFTLWDPNNARGLGAQSWGGGGIWGWGGVSLDGSGNVLTGVGNADDGVGTNGQIESPFVAAPAENSGYGDTLLELNSSLSGVVASNHPIPASAFAQTGDLDVQGTPLVFTPNGAGCGTMVALQGKSGELNFYNESQIASGPVAQYQLSPLTEDANDAYLGDPAYSPATGLVYAPVASSVSPSLYAPGLIAVNPGCGKPSVTWHAAFGTDSSSSSIPRSVPAVSAGGVVFAGSVTGNGGALWAIDASTGVVLNGGAPLLQTSGPMRVPPTIDGKWIFVLDNSGNMYGLTIDSNYAAIQAKYRAPDSRQVKGWGRNLRHG